MGPSHFASALPVRSTGASKRSTTDLVYSDLNTDDWSWRAGQRTNVRLLEVPSTWDSRYGELLASSQPLDLRANKLHVFDVTISAAAAPLAFRVQLVPAFSPRRKVSSGAVVAQRDFCAGTDIRTCLTACVPTSGEYLLQILYVGYWKSEQLIPQWSHVPRIEKLQVRHGYLSPRSGPRATRVERPISPDTSMPHWSRVERWVHQRCKTSRNFNALVAAIEMRIGREELLSLPQYMSLCPTGQCNATCEFCSVTTLRTGLIKRQLPLDSILAFAAPVQNSIQTWGIEGNGEPTLYDDFNTLVEFVLSGRASAYLITNASQFRSDLLPILLGLGSINISLNAATAETHRNVMGLKNFSEICQGIRELVKLRGPGQQCPRISASFVATRDNVFEAAEFLRLGEFDLGVDRVLLRPLSEIATEFGAVEDHRALVPYQSDIDDLFEAVDSYLKETAPRRRAEIVFDKLTFANVRPDPPIVTPHIRYRPDVLLPPSAPHWEKADTSVHLEWRGRGMVRAKRARAGSAAAQASTDSEARRFLLSKPVALWFGHELRAELTIRGQAKDLEFRVLDTSGKILSRACWSSASGAESEELTVQVLPGGTDSVYFELAHGPEPFDAELDFGRVRRPRSSVELRPAVPQPGNWEPPLPGAEVSWKDQVQRVRWQGVAGLYLAKSYSRPCVPGLLLSYPVRVVVRRGNLGIGVLSEDASRWIATFSFDEGSHDTTLQIPVGDNSRIQFVVYAESAGGLDADVDWTAAMRPQPASDADRIALVRAASDRKRTEQAQEAVHQPNAKRKPSKPDASPEPAGGATESLASAANVDSSKSRSDRGGKWLRLLHDRRTIYCQKPWTDLHNFTVDGRMDVCCIATGASQLRYSWGNAKEQSFQDVWNGPVAREFRRTVNDAEAALPPCRRCPMAKAYSGPLFDPESNLAKVTGFVGSVRMTRVRGVDRAIRAGILLPLIPVYLWHFRGFERPKVWAIIKRCIN